MCNEKSRLIVRPGFRWPAVAQPALLRKNLPKVIFCGISCEFLRIWFRIPVKNMQTIQSIVHFLMLGSVGLGKGDLQGRGSGVDA